MRLILLPVFFIYISSVFAFKKYIISDNDIFYSQNYKSCSNHSLIEIVSFQGKYYREKSSLEFDMYGRSFIGDKIKMVLLFITSGKIYLNETYDPCVLGISELCPLKVTPYFSAKGLLPFSSKQTNISEIMFDLPDFEGNVYFHFYSTITGDEIGCLKTTLTNMRTFHNKIVTWLCLSFLALSLATSFIAFVSQSSFSYALLAASHSVPGLLTFWNYFQFLTTMAMENVIYPTPLIAWASNFAFSLGLIDFFQQLIYMFHKFTKKYIRIDLSSFNNGNPDTSILVLPDFYKGIKGQLNYLKISNFNAFITSIACFATVVSAFFIVNFIISFVVRAMRRNERFIRKNWLVVNVFGMLFIAIYQLVIPDTYQPKVLAAFSLLIFVIPILILKMTAKYWGWLIVEYKSKKPHFYIIFFTYSLYKAIVLGIFDFPSKVQTISLCTIELCYLLCIMISHPFESIRAYVLELLLGTIRVLCLGAIIMFAFNISELLRILLGVMIIMISAIGLLFLFAFTVWNFFIIISLASHKDHVYYSSEQPNGLSSKIYNYKRKIFKVKSFGKVSGYDQHLYLQKQYSLKALDSPFMILKIGELAKLAYFNDVCVGCIRCQLENEKLYLMTLGVLAAYRCLGVGQKLLDHILEYAQKLNVKSIYLHVWTENKDAIEWYTKRDFRILEILPNYYTKIQPSTAYVLSRDINE
ncbi:hypothetical protein PCANB_001800 [Pneumocystis canis]|nr:hypothetical protein PCANB_001800 [Pneumocystis canis]